MATFDDFEKALKDGAKDLAKDIFGRFENEAMGDAKAFLEKTKEDLQRWTKLLAQGELSKQDFSDLVKAKKALAEIHALTQSGIALTKLERFRTGMINLVIDKAFTLFL
jgi:hypothetical protein